LRVRLSPFTGATPYWEYRLWRSDPRVRFAGQMHEKVSTSIGAVAAADRLPIGESALFLDHVGYDGDQTHKHRRNLPLLRAQLASDDRDAYNWRHLAHVLDSLGESAASEAALQRSVQIARERGGITGALAFAELIRRRREAEEDVEALLDEALKLYPDNISLIWQRVVTEIEAGRYAEALAWLDRIDVDPEMPVEDTIAYQADLFVAEVPQARGLCLFRLARYREAAVAYREAEQALPEEPAARLRRVLAEHRAGSQGRALAENDGQARGSWPARKLLRGLAVDVGGVAVRLSATDAMRAVAVHALLGKTLPSAADPVATLSFGAHRDLAPDRGPDETQGPIRLWHDDSALHIRHEESVSARVDPGRGEIGGQASDLTRVFNHVAPFVLASLLSRHDRFVLHAGAITRDNEAILILGDSGAGKSTLIFGALRDGWSPLADDLVVVRPRPSGPEACGIPKTLSVPADVLGETEHQPISRPDPRGRLPLRLTAWDRDYHRLAGVVIVDHGAAEWPEIQRLGSEELLRIVMRAMLCRQPAAVRRYVRVAIRLSALPAFTLRHSQPPERRAARAAAAMGAEFDALSRCRR
jgi:hypothetical protein